MRGTKLALFILTRSRTPPRGGGDHAHPGWPSDDRSAAAMPTSATLVDVCLLDDREKTLASPLVSAPKARWLRTHRRLQGVLSMTGRGRVSKHGPTDGDPEGAAAHHGWTLTGFRSQAGRMLGRDDVEWILDKQAGPRRARKRKRKRQRNQHARTGRSENRGWTIATTTT